MCACLGFYFGWTPDALIAYDKDRQLGGDAHARAYNALLYIVRSFWVYLFVVLLRNVADAVLLQHAIGRLGVFVR